MPIHSWQAAPVVPDKDPLPAGQVLEIELLPQVLKVVVGKGSGLNLPVDVMQPAPPAGNGAATSEHPLERPPEPSDAHQT